MNLGSEAPWQAEQARQGLRFQGQETSTGGGISRREFLGELGGLAGGSVLGFSSALGSSFATPLFRQAVPNGPSTPAMVSIAATVSGAMPARFVGLSYEKAQLSEPFFSGSNTNLIGLFRRLGPSLLRIGGNSVDETKWNATGPGQTAGETGPSDVGALAEFLRATGWSVLYGVNLAQSTPAAAAAEIAYATKTLRESLAGIEIGNEPDDYPGNYFASSWGPSDYLLRWRSFASAVLAQAPQARLTGPVISHLTDWFRSFAAAEGKRVSLLSAHYYRASGADPSSTVGAMVFYPDTQLEDYLKALKAAAVAAGVPFRMAETNSFYGGGALNVSDSYGSALWVIDHIFTIALGGCVGVNLHAGGDSAGYTPIADRNGAVVEVRPEYYGALLCALAGQGALLATNISAGSLNASAYTVQNSPTQLSVILVNKDAAQNLHVTVTCPRQVHSASIKTLAGPSLSATAGVTIQGAPVSLDGSFSSQSAYGLEVEGETFTAYIRTASAGLVKVKLNRS